MITNTYNYNFQFQSATIDITISEFGFCSSKYLVEYTIKIGDRTIQDVYLDNIGYFNDFDDLLGILLKTLQDTNFSDLETLEVLESIATTRKQLESVKSLRAIAPYFQKQPPYHEIMYLYSVASAYTGK